MTKLNFENPLANVTMFGGGDYPVRLTQLEGLEFVPKSYHTVKYSLCDGVDTISQVHDVRTITGNGDIFVTSERQVSELCDVFAEPGTLSVTRGNVTRKIAYKPGEFEINRKSRHLFVFTFQIICDSPCFEAITRHKASIFERKNMVFGNVELPIVFTERKTRVNHKNKGHKRIEPLITVKFIGDASGLVQDGFIIKNHTTGQEIKFLSQVKNFGSVIFDISQRKVLSESGENLEKYLAQETYLSDFWVDAGQNDLEFINLNTNENVYAELSYIPLYLGVF